MLTIKYAEFISNSVNVAVKLISSSRDRGT